MRVGRAVLVAVTVVTLPACGSTVADTSAAGAGPATQTGLAPATGQGPAGTGLGPAAVGTSGGVGSRDTSAGQSGSTGTTSRGADAGPAAVGRDAPAVVGSSQPSGPGVTKDAIYVGLAYSVNANAVNQAAGVGGVTHGDERGEYEAILRDINRRGGVAGRKLVPVWHQLDGASTDTVDAQYQAMCSTFTEDNHVFAVMGAGTESYQACISKSGAVIVDANVSVLDAAQFRRFPNLYELCCPSLDRIATTQVTSLADQRYFSPWDTATGGPGAAPVKVGVLTYDDRAFKGPVDRILVPGLAKLGYRAETAYVAKPQSTSDLSNMAAAVQAAELKFNSAGVTHVIIFEATGALSLFFLQDAENQHYRPRYGINSGTFFQGLIGTAPKPQFTGATGFSFTPLADLPAQSNPENGPYSNAARRYCSDLMRKNGFTFDSSNAEAIALSQCDQMYFLRDVARASGGVLTAATFQRAAEALGGSFVAGIALGEYFGPGRHDGVSTAYWWRYDGGCDCMRYTGPRRRIP